MEMYGMSGERLGTIGQPTEGLPLQFPAWKQAFLAKPSVSTRRGIAWGYQPPVEDTDTLVLTAPSGQFVDVRFPKGTRSPHEVKDHPSFWAFSGEAKTTFHDATDHQYAIDMPYTAHCSFLHQIDSRGPQSRMAGDEGDMFLLTNGDFLEMGIMLNPASGQKELYKEYWQGADDIASLTGEDDSHVCIVARVTSPPSVEGIIIRLGGRIQGILSRQQEDGTEAVEVERWIRGSSPDAKPIESEDLPQGPWSRDVRSNGSFPGAWLCMPGRQVGDNLKHDDIAWTISEVQR